MPNKLSKLKRMAKQDKDLEARLLVLSNMVQMASQ
jgi:hypothetical protein